MLCFDDVKDASRVFHFFEQISKIPHASGNTAPIADYLVTFAKERGLSYVRDEADNVLIKKGATAGYESRPSVILQGHTDMVAEKDPECQTDMDKEGLSIYREGDFLRARGTTLGGDDGVAVAYALALLDSEDIPHPPIEALFTSDEEIGLIGATRLSAEHITGRKMINIDSDEEGVFTVGCAGGVRCDITLPVQYEPSNTEGYKIRVFGLSGGHSGMEIDKGRANAILLLGELLSELSEACELSLSSLEGGVADNAIPSEASAILKLSIDPCEIIRGFKERKRAQYSESEKTLEIECEALTEVPRLMREEDTARVISLLSKCKSGVLRMSEELLGLPETSQNAGIAKTDEDAFRLTVSVRSSRKAEKACAVSALKALADSVSASLSTRGEYPAWEYLGKTELLDTMEEVYRRMYGKAPKVTVIHAGLECGILSEKLPGLECVSIGPNNYDIHTPREHLSISSTARVWEYIKEVLKGI